MINFKKNIQHYIQTGDTLIVHFYIPYIVKGKEMLLKRKFKGICIAKKNRFENSTITVEARLKNLSITKKFFLSSPYLVKIELVQLTNSKKSKLFN